MSVPAKATGRTKKSAAWKSIKNNYMLYLFLVPALVYVAVFCYAPMYGVQIAFKNFKASKGIMGSAWVGLAHFKTFFSSPRFMLLLTNTLSVSVYSIIVGFPIPIILALLFNYVQYPWFKKFAQTVSYAPHFISTIVLVAMMQQMFASPSALMKTGGIVNTVLLALGFDSVDFMTSSATFRSMYAWSGVWSGVGWGSILYMATLSGIDEQQYEAARLDGAGRLQCMWYITLPMLIPTAMTLFILDMGKVMSVGFEKAFAMQNELNRETSQVLSTYVYTQGLGEGNYSFSTAVDLFNSVINLALIVTVNAISRRVSEVSLW